MTARLKGRDVYVIGAGFSAGLGYPLTNSLLMEIWKRLDDSQQQGLEKVIRFHHPFFEQNNLLSYPNIEQLLTEIKINYDMFDATVRSKNGAFKRDDLLTAQSDLLFAISEWFHELYEPAQKNKWFSKFSKKLRRDNAVVISFNWDLLLDYALFDEVSAESYGLLEPDSDMPTLIKPHGSLNWYDANDTGSVKAEKTLQIFKDHKNEHNVRAFMLPRGIKSNVGNRYSPLIVPPTHIKDFSHPISKVLWRKATEALSTAKNIYVVGYSLPLADLQAQFILRCGFHNQIDGLPKRITGRSEPTGLASITVVNPDPEAARRVQSVAGPNAGLNWIPQRVSDWVQEIT